MVLGIIGQGFVGSAVREGFNTHFQVETYDTDPSKNPTQKSVSALVAISDVIFICVPTPMKKDGSCDTSIVETVVEQVDEALDNLNKNIDVIIKSTVPPGTTQNLQADCIASRLFFNPEFLTEANWKEDFINQDKIIIGTTDPFRDEAGIELIKQFHLIRFPNVGIVLMSATEAEFLKYVTNTFLAMKVSFCNEMFDIAEKLGIKWSDLTDILSMDGRLGSTHWKVPGPDGHRGFGGSCVKPETLVLLSDNTSRRICDLQKGDVVMSVNGELTVVNNKCVEDVSVRSYLGELIEIETENGVFNCTPDHIIPIERDGIILQVPAKDIRLTDYIYIYRQGETGPS